MSERSETTSKNLEIQVSEGQLLKNYHFVELTELTDECINRIADAVVKKMPTAEPIGELIRCRDCKHFHENVWGNEIGLDDLPIIIGHEVCDAWGREWTQSCADGYCHMAERRSDGRADQ